jgi:O-antigen/teichoic acid export membrane protein
VTETGEDVRTNAELTAATGSGLKWVAYTRVAIELSMLASMVVLARLIPPSAFGVFAVVMIVQELAITLPSEGVGNAIVQRRSLDRRHLQTGMVLSLAVGLALALVTVVLSLTVARPLFGEETADLMLLSLPCCLLGALVVVPLAILRRRLSFARVAVIELVSTSTRLVATLVLAFLGLDASALVLGLLAGGLVTTAIGCVLVPLPLPRWHRPAARELTAFGGPAALAAVAWSGFRNGDYAIVNAKLGAAQAGLYWRSYQLSVEYQKKVGTILAQMAFPVLARAQGEDDMLALRHRMARGLTVVLFPMLVLFAILAPVLIPWLFGPAWEPAVVPAQILAAGGAATVAIDAIAPALMAAGRSRAVLGYGVAHFAVYIALVLAFASHGIIAVALVAASVHGAFLLVAYQVLLGNHVRALGALVADLAPALVSCVALAAVALPLDAALARTGAPVLIHLTAVSAAGAVAYLLALRICARAAWLDLLATFQRLLPSRVPRRRRPVAAATPAAGSASLPGS